MKALVALSLLFSVFVGTLVFHGASDFFEEAGWFRVPLIMVTVIWTTALLSLGSIGLRFVIEGFRKSVNS
jgi:hypothetical protein